MGTVACDAYLIHEIDRRATLKPEKLLDCGAVQVFGRHATEHIENVTSSREPGAGHRHEGSLTRNAIVSCGSSALSALVVDYIFNVYLTWCDLGAPAIPPKIEIAGFLSQKTYGKQL